MNDDQTPAEEGATVHQLDPSKPRTKRPKRERPQRRGWQIGFTTTNGGEVKATLGNMVLVLENDPVYRDTFAYNEMAGAVYRSGQRVTDEDYAAIRVEVERTYNFTPSRDVAVDAIALLAKRRSYHPVRQHLETLVWDGKPRIARVLVEILGAPDTPLYQTMIRR